MCLVSIKEVNEGEQQETMWRDEWALVWSKRANITIRNDNNVMPLVEDQKSTQARKDFYQRQFH